MFHTFVPTAALKYVVETHEIGLDIRARVGNGVADARLGREVHGDMRLVLSEYAVHQRLVGNVAAIHYETSVGDLVDFLQTPLLYRYVVIVIEIVYAYDFDVPVLPEQSQNKGGTDESGCSGHQNAFSFETHIVIRIIC